MTTAFLIRSSILKGLNWGVPGLELSGESCPSRAGGPSVGSLAQDIGYSTCRIKAVIVSGAGRGVKSHPSLRWDGDLSWEDAYWMEGHAHWRDYDNRSVWESGDIHQEVTHLRKDNAELRKINSELRKKLRQEKTKLDKERDEHTKTSENFTLSVIDNGKHSRRMACETQALMSVMHEFPESVTRCGDGVSLELEPVYLNTFRDKVIDMYKRHLDVPGDKF